MPELKGMRLASAVSWSYRRCETSVEGWRSSPSSSATPATASTASTSSAVGEACSRDGGYWCQRRRLPRGSQTHLRGRHLP